MQENEKKRQIRISFDRARLHSSIEGAMRRKSIPANFRGKDLIRGTIIGLVDHEEYTIEKAISRAAEMCKITGNVIDYNTALFAIAEVLVISLANGSMKFNSPRNTEITELEFIIEDGLVSASDDDLKKVKGFVDELIEGLVRDVRKDYCYAMTINFLEKEGIRVSELSGHIIKSMVFKKLIADESTKQCVYEYAYRKSLGYDEDKPESEIEEIVNKYASEILPENMTAYEFALNLVEKIYACTGSPLE